MRESSSQSRMQFRFEQDSKKKAHSLAKLVQLPHPSELFISSEISDRKDHMCELWMKHLMSEIFSE